jgi:hypothetical protein
MATIPDYSDVKPEAPKTEELEQLSSLVDQTLKVEDEIEELDAELKKKKLHHIKLTETDIPGVMNKVKMKKFTTTDGFDVEIKPVIRANVPEANKSKVFKWLRANNHGAMIKTLLQISISPGQEKELQKLLGMKAMDKFPDRKMNGSIHYQTLVSFIKKEKEKDAAFPMSMFNAVEIDQAKIKAPKKKK